MQGINLSSYCLALTKPFNYANHPGKAFVISILAVCIINALALNGYLSPLALGLSNMGIGCLSIYPFFYLFANNAEGTVRPNYLYQKDTDANYEKDGIFITHLTRNLIKSITITLLVVSTVIAINAAGCADLLSTELMASTTLGLFAFHYAAQMWYVRQRKQLNEIS